MKMMTKIKTSEKGSVFFYIILAIVLFATLAFTVSRGMRGKQTSAMSERKAEIIASDILSYTQKLSQTVDRLRRNGCSESELSFSYDSDGDNNYQDSGDTYYNANALTDLSCHVFHPLGGNIKFIKIPEIPVSELNSGDSLYNITGSLRTSLGDATQNELAIMIISNASNTTWTSPEYPNMRLLCEKINNLLGNSFSTNGRNILTAGNHSTLTLPQFDGTYSGGQAIVSSNNTACYSDISGSNRFIFYHVLIVR